MSTLNLKKKKLRWSDRAIPIFVVQNGFALLCFATVLKIPYSSRYIFVIFLEARKTFTKLIWVLSQRYPLYNPIVYINFAMPLYASQVFVKIGPVVRQNVWMAFSSIAVL